MQRLVLTPLLFFVIAVCPLLGQQIALKVNTPPSGVTVTKLTDGKLNFGSLLPGQGLVQIPLTGAEAEVIELRVRYRFTRPPLSVTIFGPNQLRKAAAGLPFTIGSAWEAGKPRNPNQATPFNNSRTFNFRFSFFKRTVYLYIYIYGNIDVGNVPAGDYSGAITVEVTNA